MKKEKELAEKRKNDPPLELANDHPVRKLISRFRKISDTKSHTAVDVEKLGSVSSETTRNHTTPETVPKETRIISVSENNGKVPKLSSGTARWTKLLGSSHTSSSSTDDGQTGSAANPAPTAASQNKTGMNDLSGKHLEAKVNELPKVSIKPMSKWGRMFAKSQEPIEECPEEEAVRNNLKKTDSTDSGILRSNNRLDQIGEESSDMPQVTRDSMGSLGGPLSAAEQHMLTSLYDIRLEIKEEMDNLGQKINRIDEQISEILRFFSPSSTPCSSTSTYPSSKLNSPQNVTVSHSVDHSPKRVHSSPPYRMGLASGLRVRASVLSSGERTPPLGDGRLPGSHPSNPDTLHTMHSPPSSEKVTTSSSSTSNNNSRRSSKSSGTSQDGSGGGSGGSGSSGGALVYVRSTADHIHVTHSSSPSTAYQVPTDDEHVHVKDRDLDIF